MAASVDVPAVGSSAQPAEQEVSTSNRDVEAENLAAALGSTRLEPTQQTDMMFPAEASSKSVVAESGQAQQVQQAHQTWGPGLAEHLAKQRKEIVAHHTAVSTGGNNKSAMLQFCVAYVKPSEARAG